jgi:ABC-2 type transport system ATP-binding protein
MIEAKTLTKKFGSRTAIRDISFTMQKGEVVGFLGPNGAGKTTTLRILTGYFRPTSGFISAVDPARDGIQKILEIYQTASARFKVRFIDPDQSSVLTEDYVKKYALVEGCARTRGVSNRQGEQRGRWCIRSRRGSSRRFHHGRKHSEESRQEKGDFVE